ncbi:MAG TPA: cyclase family protein [Candidatus Limnocylindrales bacterium]|nr:cyclase family protein [Candidatus Limnocylindrales bacterium]
MIEQRGRGTVAAMADIDFDKIPRFSELPVRKDAPPESNWGVFGDDDELGCLNFLTARGVVEAAKLVRKGRVFRLDTPINYATPPLFNRSPARHTIVSFEQYGLLGHDDSLDAYNTQEGSQWDGLGHVGHVRHRAYYNGVTDDQIQDGTGGKLGIHKWSNKFVGRGVLIDVRAHTEKLGRPIDPLTSASYSLADLEDALAAQHATLEPGSILLVRTGWLGAYLASSDEQKIAMAPLNALAACGIESSSELIAWLWDHRVAAIGTDCPAVEPWPWSFGDESALHYRTLSLMGLPLGEQFVLDELAADCAADGSYEFMLVSAPMHLEGGIATPPNAVAIK